MSFFTFENLGGDYPLLGANVENGAPTAAFGLSDAQKYLVATLFDRPVVYLTADALTAKRAYEAISALSAKKCVLLNAKDEVLTYRKAGSKDALYRRINALARFARGGEVLVADI